MKNRIDVLLRWSIYLYLVFIIAGIYAISNTLEGGIWDLVNILNFVECEVQNRPRDFEDYYEKVCYQTIDYIQLLVLTGIIATRYLISGKTYQR